MNMLVLLFLTKLEGNFFALNLLKFDLKTNYRRLRYASCIQYSSSSGIIVYFSLIWANVCRLVRLLWCKSKYISWEWVQLRLTLDGNSEISVDGYDRLCSQSLEIGRKAIKLKCYVLFDFTVFFCIWYFYRATLKSLKIVFWILSVISLRKVSVRVLKKQYFHI